jgi:hypothetical protein
MRRVFSFLFPAIAAAALVLSAGSARADTCFGGHHPTTPDTGTTPPATDGGVAWKGKLPRQVGAGLLLAAAVSTGWLCFRRKGPGEK